MVQAKNQATGPRAPDSGRPFHWRTGGRDQRLQHFQRLLGRMQLVAAVAPAENIEKLKPEIKEYKAEKVESDGVFEPGIPGPDPRLDQIIQVLSGLTVRVAQLADQVEALKKAANG